MSVITKRRLGVNGLRSPIPIHEDRVHAMALIPQFIHDSIAPALVEACALHGLDLEVPRVRREDYPTLVQRVDNLITWGMKHPASFYHELGANTLFIENGLLSQRNNISIFTEGYFADSDLCINREYEQPATQPEVRQIYAIVRDRFGWDMFAGGDPAGPILYAIQRSSDMPCQFYFPGNNMGYDSIEAGLRIAARHLNKEVVWIRPHPRFHNEWDMLEPKYRSYFGPGWSVHKDGSIYDLLPKCSALITINSTVATEALSLGLPVATLGHSTYTGAHVTWECADNTDLLHLHRYHTPNRAAVWNYLAAVLRHQLPVSASPQQIANNVSFRRWIERIK